MNMNELNHTQNPQLDEISLDQIGRGIGKGLGAVGKTVGAIAGVPQGLAQAAKRGYRSSVGNIGGAAAPTQAPTATGMINPATGRAYVPSDFDEPEEPMSAVQATGTAGGARTAQQIQQDIKNLDVAYRQRMRQLQSELSGAGSAPAADDFTQAQRDYMAAIGSDAPAAAAPTAAPAAASVPREFMTTLQALPAANLAAVKKLLQAQARIATNEAAKKLPMKMPGIKGLSPTANNPNTSKSKSRKPSKLPKLAKQAGKFAAGIPGAVATGTGVAVGSVGGMKQAYAKGKQAGQKYVGGGSMSMDDLQMAIFSFTPEQAKQALAFIKQIEAMRATPAAPAARKAPAKPAARPATYAPAGKATAMPTQPFQVPAKPAVPVKPMAVAESLTWSKNWDPSASLIKKLK